jgi:hypothetical protein
VRGIMKKEEFKDKFDALSKDGQDIIKEIVSHFHFRDGRLYEDGSMGTIRISPKELRDILAYAITRLT